MKKRINKRNHAYLVAFLLCLGAGGFIYERNFVGNHADRFFLDNVEALTQSEATIPGSGECYGLAKYSTVGVFEGEEQVRAHTDNDETHGQDHVTTYSVKKCIAAGIGTLMGNPGGYLKYEFKSSKNEDCTGKCKQQ